MIRLATNLPYAGIRGRGPRILDMQPTGNHVPSGAAYDGPFACSISGTTVEVAPGYVLAGDYGEWGFPGPIDVWTGGYTPGAVQDDFVTFDEIGTWIVVLNISVNPLNGMFDTFGINYPYLESLKINAPTDQPVKNIDLGRRRVLCTAEITLSGGSYLPTSIRQHQYGDIYVPTFYTWGLYGASTAGNITADAPTWVAGWSHGHFVGRVVIDVPGVENVRSSMGSRKITDEDGTVLWGPGDLQINTNLERWGGADL